MHNINLICFANNFILKKKKKSTARILNIVQKCYYSKRFHANSQNVDEEFL